MRTTIPKASCSLVGISLLAAELVSRPIVEGVGVDMAAQLTITADKAKTSPKTKYWVLISDLEP